jgi:spoIIIJ-associated protein
MMSDSEQELDQQWEDEADEAGDDAGDEEGAKADGAEPNGAADGSGERRPRRRRRRGNGAQADWIPDNDERAKQALEFVTQVIKEMELDCRVRLRRPKQGEENPEIHIDIAGPDAGRVIGKKGQVLSALQFLVHRVVNRSGLEKRHVLVDAEGYRSRRDNSLATMARRLGKQAVEQGKIITFEPMNPRDRRVVHLALAKFEGVITKSDGEGQSRRVQIIPVRRTTAQT